MSTAITSNWGLAPAQCKNSNADGQFRGGRRASVGHRQICAENDEPYSLKAIIKCRDLIALLRAAALTRDLRRGIEVHEDVLKCGLLPKCLDALVIMYAKCGALEKAQELLDRHVCKNVMAWNGVISGYVRLGHGDDALRCFEHMLHEGLSPNAVTYACILKACGSTKALDKGKQMHDEIVRQGLLSNDIVLGNALVDMYVKCGTLAKAWDVLAELPTRDAVSWNSLINGYAQQGRGIEALHCYDQMQADGVYPDGVTFVCILKACGILKAVQKGEQIHDEIMRQGLLGKDIVLGTALVDMYAKCGALAKAHSVLDDLPLRNIVTWNALITGYCHAGRGKEAMNCYERMQQEGLSPNSVTFTGILKACGCTGAFIKGTQIHEEIAKQGILQNNLMIGTSLIDMYVKCGALAKARQVLNELTSRDVVSWNAVIAGYAQDGEGEQALECLEQMQKEGLSPSTITFTCILKACGNIGAADKAKQVHDEILKQRLLQDDIGLGSALVDMYAKCGALAMARQALEELPSQDVISWNALIAGHSHKGEIEQVLNCFQEMQLKGLTPNAITFSCALNAFSNCGLIEDSNTCFIAMNTKYGIDPELEHYTCMVDLYGRAGHFLKAMEVIRKMPTCSYSAVWSSLLGACRNWGNMNVGRWAYEQAVSVDKKDSAAYVLLADIYAMLACMSMQYV